MADDYKCTALHWAVEQDVPESVTLLLAGGADASIKNNSGHGALHLAVYKNSLKALKALLDSKVITSGSHLMEDVIRLMEELIPFVKFDSWNKRLT